MPLDDDPRLSVVKILLKEVEFIVCCCAWWFLM
jgi:hypothetical protein